MGELIMNFIYALIAGILLVFAVLVLLYRRVLPPFVNMASLFLAPLGAVIALMITGYALSMPVFHRAADAVRQSSAKNSILLIDFAIEEIAARHRPRRRDPRRRSQACAGRSSMTSVAMIAGMLPVALALGGDGSWRQPMGVAVIGGIALSTVLTLIIVPAAFTIADDIEKWLAPRFGKWFTNGGEGRIPPPRPVELPRGVS